MNPIIAAASLLLVLLLEFQPLDRQGRELTFRPGSSPNPKTLSQPTSISLRQHPGNLFFRLKASPPP